jgi:Predicted acyl-CoA transferases/carnitine dehydratase
MSRTPELVNEGAPLFGEHTEGVLTELGYNAQEILELRAEGVVA